MIDFIKKIFENNKISPSKICLQSFNDNFPDAVDTEWSVKEIGFEAIFYRHHLEHIALFNHTGVLLEYRQNLPNNFLPNNISEKAQQEGEIMNSVLINRGNNIEYQLIVRDSQLRRFLKLYSEAGDLMLSKEL